MAKKKKSDKKKNKPLKKNPDALLAEEYGKDKAPMISIDKAKEKGKGWMAKLKEKVSSFTKKQSAEASEKGTKLDRLKKKIPVKINKEGPLGAMAKRMKEQEEALKALDN